LFVSIIGVAWPAATAALYAACVGYRGGGGSTLRLNYQLMSHDISRRGVGMPN
jgi:hypothetical protein